MNDDVEAAEAHLSKGSSPFHQVGFALLGELVAPKYLAV